MSQANLDRVKRIFHQVFEAAETEREQLLDALCGEDESLRGQVESLLAANEGASDFLDSREIDEVNAVHAASVAGSESPIEGPGSRIGPYKLLQVIGEGGFGVVYMAEQETPIRRRVALKVVKPGMDTKQVIARFEAERQALAILDHPNIAKVFEAGTTPTGRPYFVMELVRGIPITEYCDEQKLDTRERLALFADVCSAVHHAHQHGIIHRDIKPSNVLVTLHDGTPVPMVIDFGIAKATHQRLTDRTLFTEFNQFIGTPAYMSPEQAAYEGLDVDGRSDVYSLGVLLYELLTGTTPFDTAVMKRAVHQELLRILKEDEPPKPSTRISAMGKESATNASLRRLDTAGLVRLLRGDLDWIVMKALEKDRRRRYESATDLADDINRYFSHQPILARRPSRIYKARKLFRRRRGPVMAAAAAVLALVGEIAYVNWQGAFGPATAAPDGSPGAVSNAPDPVYTLLLEDFAGFFDLSPDGRRLAFTLSEGNPPGLYISDPVSALPRLFHPLDVGPLTRPRWSPDGTRIAVLQRTEGAAGATATEYILVIDPEGNEISRTPISTPVGTWLIAWGPDQQSFVYSRENAIYSMALDGRATKLAGDEAVGFAPYLGGFSPDGDWIAYSTGNAGDVPGFDVWVVRADGGEAHRLTQHPGMDLTPDWGADGSLYFVSDRSGSRNIWRLRIDSETGERVGEPEQVTTFTDAQIRGPSVAHKAGSMAVVVWRYRETVQVTDAADPASSTTLARGGAIDLSPDGSRVLYRFELHDEAAVRQANDGLYSIASSGGAPTRLTPESHYSIGPVRFSADGSMVTYLARSADGFAEYRVPATGGDPVRIRSIVLRSDFETPRGGWSPDWSFQVLVRGNGLYRVPADGEPILLAELAEWDLDNIAISPDGRYVAALGWDQPAAEPREFIINPAEQVRQFRPSDIYVVPVQGGEMRRITTDAERTQKSYLSWHPDGQRLMYSAQTEENVWSRRMAWLDGRPTTPFFDEPDVLEMGGRWADDDQTYYFLGHVSGSGENTYRRNPDGTVDLLWVSGELPFGRFLGADGTLVYTAWKRTDELWMIEDYR